MSGPWKSTLPSWDTKFDNGRTLITPNGKLRSLPRSLPRGRLNVAIVGHSFLSNCWGNTFTTSAGVTDNGDGTLTATFGATHGLKPGDRIKIRASGNTALNLMSAPVLTAPKATNVITAAISGLTDQHTAGPGGTSTFICSPTPIPTYSSGFMTWLYAKLGGRLRIVADASVPGASINTSIALAPLVLDACTEAIDCVIVMPLFNDIYAGIMSLAQMKAAVGTLYDIFEARGLADRVVWMGELPSNGTAYPGPPISHAAAVLNMLQLNTYLSQYITERGGMFVPTWRASSGTINYVDKTNANLTFMSTMVNTTDFIHPSGQGAWALGGNQLAGLLSQMVRGTQAPGPLHALDEYANNPYQTLDNPDFSGTGGTLTNTGSATVSGSVPDGWTLTITGGAGAATQVAISTVERSIANGGDASGTFLRVATTNGQGVTFSLSRSSSSARFSSADRMRSTSEVRLTSGTSPGNGGPTLLDYVRSAVNFTYTNFHTSGPGFGAGATSVAIADDTGWLNFTSPDYVIPEAPTGCSYYFQWKLQSGASDATVDLFMPALEKVT